MHSGNSKGEMITNTFRIILGSEVHRTITVYNKVTLTNVLGHTCHVIVLSTCHVMLFMYQPVNHFSCEMLFARCLFHHTLLCFKVCMCESRKCDELHSTTAAWSIDLNILCQQDLTSHTRLKSLLHTHSLKQHS